MPPLPSVENFVLISHKCGKERNLLRWAHLHAYLRKSGLEAHTSLGNYLVSMLVEVESMLHAQQVFDKLLYRDDFSWNSLITGYVKCGESQCALALYQKMQEHDSLHPSGRAFVALLNACSKLTDLEGGHHIHAEIARKGLLERDVFIASSLVNMYAKCGSLTKAQEVFDKLPIRNIVAWNALIAGYAEHGHGEEALNCFKHMQHEGISPDAVTLVCSLKACAGIGEVIKGQDIHVDIGKKGLEKERLVGNALVDMYAKCGFLAEAQGVFDKLPVQNIVSQTTLIAGYAEHGFGEEALNCFEQMQHGGMCLDAVTFVCSLKACGSIGAIDKGCEIHTEIARKGLEGDLFVGSTLVDMYAKCGLLAEAHEVFDKLPGQDVVSWTTLIAGYLENGHAEEALNCFEQMQHEGLSLGAVTFVCSLKACGSIGTTDNGREIHAMIVKTGFLERDVCIGSVLVDMYAKCGLLTEAWDTFDKLPVQGMVSWTSLIAGYAEHGCGQEALDCFEQMEQEGVSPSAVTFVCSLKACASMGAIAKGREIHSEIAKRGLLERDVYIGSTLVDMYAKCGSLAKAQEVFDKLPVRNVVSWTALLTGYAEHGGGEAALKCFEQMQHEGISPVAVTIVCSLKACGSIGATGKGREIHSEITRKGLETELLVGNTLVDMYAKCCLLAEAQVVFDKLPIQDSVSWTALISGYAEHGGGEEALNCLEQMQHISLDASTIVCSLKACGSIGATVKGQEIHAEGARKGLDKEPLLGNTLVDMYVKCGLLAEAQEVFDKLLVRDVVSWTALIAGYSQLGESANIFHIFDRMIGEGIKPDLVTFVSVLNACSHAGLVDKGQMYFEAISNDYGLIPTLEHHICMIDLLGRAGHIDKAVEMIKKMPYGPGILVWHIVLGACRKWGNVEVGRLAFEQAVRLDEDDAAAYVCMFNIYADAAMQEEANKIVAMRVEKQAWKMEGCC